MTPLEVQVVAGLRDHDLLKILEDLDRARAFGGGLSPREEDTYSVVWMRLDLITDPKIKA